MDAILQIVPVSGYKAVFDRSEDGDYEAVDIENILEETDANLLILPVDFFALVKSKIPGTGIEDTRIVGVYLDPDYGYLELCERGDDRVVYAGRLLGYLPPEPGSGSGLLENYRWITAARIDGRYVDEDAWKALAGRKVGKLESIECV